MPFYSSPPDGVLLTGAGQDEVLEDLIDVGPMGGTFDCEFRPVPLEHAVPTYVAERDSTGWVDATAALMAAHPETEYVSLGYSAEGGSASGWADCTTQLTSEVTAWSVSMTGFGTLDLIHIIDALPGPILPANPVNGVIDGAVLRPTPLTWPGQDPDNIANRLLWLPSEVASLHDSFTMTDLYAYELRVTVSVAAYVPIGVWMCIV